MHIEITHDLPELNHHLTTLYQRLNGDLTPLMSKIGGILTGSTQQRFNDKAAPNGLRWQNLKPETQKRKGNNNILVGKGESGLRDIVNEITEQSVSIGTSLHYGKYHQFGTRHMVARPFLGISNDDRAEILAEIAEYLDGATK